MSELRDMYHQEYPKTLYITDHNQYYFYVTDIHGIRYEILKRVELLRKNVLSFLARKIGIIGHARMNRQELIPRVKKYLVFVQI